MTQCHVCGSTEFRPEIINKVFEIGDKHVLFENIPAQVCSRCGEQVFSRETTERVRRMVHEQKEPIKSISMDVFAF